MKQIIETILKFYPGTVEFNGMDLPMAEWYKLLGAPIAVAILKSEEVGKAMGVGGPLISSGVPINMENLPDGTLELLKG